MVRGRHRQDLYDEPSSFELGEATRQDEWVWVEGRVYVESFNEKKRLAMDKARVELAKLGLVLHTQNGNTAEAAPLRRRWTTQRMDLSLAAEILDDYQDGISLQDYCDALFDKTPEWTPAHQKAAQAKTYVIFHKLKGMGLATKGPGRQALLFPTRKQSSKGLPPILLAVVKAHLSELGEEWPERTVKKLVRTILEANEAVAVGKAAAVAHQ